MVKCLRMICLVTAIGLPTSAWAQIRTQIVASGFDHPVAVVPDPAIPNVLYVVEQGGLVKVIQNGQVLATPFIDLRSAVIAGGERGLLGMAFSPTRCESCVLQLHQQHRWPWPYGRGAIRSHRRGSLGRRTDEPFRSAMVNWRAQFIAQPFANHNGGNLVFGPDGYLYIGLGDGGNFNDFPTTMRRRPVACSGNSCGST